MKLVFASLVFSPRVFRTAALAGVADSPKQTGPLAYVVPRRSRLYVVPHRTWLYVVPQRPVVIEVTEE